MTFLIMAFYEGDENGRRKIGPISSIRPLWVVFVAHALRATKHGAAQWAKSTPFGPGRTVRHIGLTGRNAGGGMGCSANHTPRVADCVLTARPSFRHSCHWRRMVALPCSASTGNPCHGRSFARRARVVQQCVQQCATVQQPSRRGQLFQITFSDNTITETIVEQSMAV